MAFRTITDTVTTTQTLASGDELVISPTGFLAVDGRAIAADAGASFEIGIYGVAIGTNFGGVSIEDGGIVELIIGATGQVGSTGNAAVEVTASSIVRIVNAGTVQSTGSSAIDLDRVTGTSGASFSLSNSGTITSTGQSVLIDSGTFVSRVFNSGIISAVSANALRLDDESGGALVRNSGEISSVDGSGVFATRNLVINNSGEISSAETIGLSVDGTLRLVNSGTISGEDEALAARGNAIIANRGDIIGNVEMGEGDGNFDGRSGTVVGVVFGEEGNDTLRGGSDNDVLNGGEDADTILGNAGDDTLIGASGEDVIAGGSGDDVIFGGGNSDVLRGDTGDDVLDGANGNDNMFGGSGNDELLGGNNNDTMRGDSGNDTLEGDAGDDFLFGGTDDDVLSGGADTDTLFGETGDDVLMGGAGNDRLRGDSGNDTLSGDAGADNLQGGAGADVIDGGTGRDDLFGGLGADVFVFSSVADSGIGGALRDRIHDFERGVDLIDVSELSDPSFTFQGTGALSGSGPSLGYTVLAPGFTLLRLDVDGNGSLDMQMLVLNTPVLSASDFLL